MKTNCKEIKNYFTNNGFYYIICMQLPHTLFYFLAFGRIALLQCGAFLLTETTGKAGGDALAKSFRVGERAKRVANKLSMKLAQVSIGCGITRLRAVGASDVSKKLFVRLETPAGEMPFQGLFKPPAQPRF